MLSFDSGGAFKSKAQAAQANAETVATEQEYLGYKRELLSAIRQERLATADVITSGTVGIQNSGISSGRANIYSNLASGVGQFYEDKDRQEQYKDYIEEAQQAWEDYSDAQASKAQSWGIVAGVTLMTGAAVLGAAGAIGAGSAATTTGGATATTSVTSAAGATSVVGTSTAVSGTTTMAATGWSGAMAGMKAAVPYVSSAYNFGKSTSYSDWGGSMKSLASAMNTYTRS